MKLKKGLTLLICVVFFASIIAGCNSSKKLQGTIGNIDTDYTGYLGYGYNLLTDDYFNFSSIKDNIPALDTDKLAKDGLIRTDNISDTRVLYISGTDVSSYQSDFASSFHLSESGVFFKGSFSSSFTESNHVSSTESFVKTSILVAKKKEYIDLSSKSNLKDYMTAKFKDDVNGNMSPSELIQNYGTHILLNISMGGRMDLNYMYHNYYQTSSESLKASAKAAYNGISASGSASFSKSAMKLYENSTFNAKQLGGASVDITSLNDAQKNYKNWFDSLNARTDLDLIDAGNLGFSNSSPSKNGSQNYEINNPGFIPIWKFAEDENRQQEIENEYKILAGDNKTSFNGLQTKEYIDKIYITHGKSMDAAKSALSHDMPTSADKVILDYDLNNGAGGEFICMGYTLTPNPNQAITDIKLDYRKNKKKNQLKDTVTIGNVNYSKINLDLTKGTGGDYYIVLYHTENPSAGQPLTFIGIEYGDNNFTFAEDNILNNWSPVYTFGGNNRLDVNKGAGGRDIFIWEKR